MTLDADKHLIRRDALGRRAAVDGATRARFSASLAHRGPQSMDRLAGPGPLAVAVFLPIRHEPDTGPLIEALAGLGHTVLLPATPPRGEPLRFRAWRPGDALVAGRFGTREPAPGAPERDPDALFVPLAAFDRRGRRLGYGAGYYDGALARLRRRRRVAAIGIAFAAQEVAAVPTEPHDEPLDAVLTEDGLLTFGSDPCASSSSAMS